MDLLGGIDMGGMTDYDSMIKRKVKGSFEDNKSRKKSAPATSIQTIRASVLSKAPATSSQTTLLSYVAPVRKGSFEDNKSLKKSAPASVLSKAPATSRQTTLLSYVAPVEKSALNPAVNNIDYLESKCPMLYNMVNDSRDRQHLNTLFVHRYHLHNDLGDMLRTLSLEEDWCVKTDVGLDFHPKLMNLEAVLNSVNYII